MLLKSKILLFTFTHDKISSSENNDRPIATMEDVQLGAKPK